MKRILLLLLLIQLSTMVFSLNTTYYVDSSITDTYPVSATVDFSTYNPVTFATTGGTANVYKTIGDINAKTFGAGDQIKFRKGQTFTGGLNFSESGVHGNPIIITSFGTGNNPIINGFITVPDWTTSGGNIWESTGASSLLSNCKYVTIGGVNAAMGREPEIGSYYTLQSHTANTSITSTNLNSDVINWASNNTAEVCQRKEYWIWETEKITAHSGSTLTYTSSGGPYAPEDGNGFFIQNDVRTLDTQNEWFFDAATDKVKIYSTAKPINVKIASVDFGFDTFAGKYITIDGLVFTGMNTHGIKLNGAQNITIQNCTIKGIGQDGINVYNTDSITVNANTIKNCNFMGYGGYGGSSYELQNNYETITNNVIDSTFMIVGVGRGGSSAGIATNADYTLLQYNRITNCGYDGILTTSQHGQVRNNFIDYTCVWTSDGGCIYTTTDNTALIIDGNICLRAIGYTPATWFPYIGARGIYLDSNSSYITVSNNICAYNYTGIYFSSGADHNIITNNLCFGNSAFQLHMNDSNNGVGDTELNTVTGNQFVSNTATQRTMYAQAERENIATFMSVSGGNYYARPLDDTKSILNYYPSIASSDLRYKTLVEWKAYSGDDVTSFSSPFSVASESDIRLEYNSSSLPITVALGQNYRDLKTNQDHTSITIDPFKGVVLLKHNPYAGTATRNVIKHNGKILHYNGKALKY